MKLSSLRTLVLGLAGWWVLGMTVIHAAPAETATPPPASATVELKWSELPPIPDSRGLAGMYAGLSGDALLAAGGANFPDALPWEGGTKTWTDRVWVLEAPDGSWKEAGTLPSPRGYGVGITVPGHGVVCVGGNDSARHFADAFVLSWTPAGGLVRRDLPPLPEPAANLCGAAMGTTVWIAGGEREPGATAASDGFWSLDVAAPNPEWKRRPTWPGPARTLAVAGTQSGKFILAGGVALRAGADGKQERVQPYLSDGYAFD
ncbi:MAG: galactose oxidase, partial [Kiritimatiellae bacterium]|nr:galactose oxidase [Kiritimatiellia bacterium]